MQVAIGAIIAGKYELERPLARGGMGSVWVARHVKLGSRLAVKFLDPRFAATPAFIDRFEREARAAAALQSPHVVHVQDYGVEETTPYLVMELLQGEDLGQRLHRVGRLSLPDTTRVLVQVGKALRKAHEAGIVHRDLKPANLFLARIDDEEIAKVLDFGIAKETINAVGAETKTGEVMGSPHYMSPEQARADKGIDHRADLWALGVILYRTVTGALPFPGDVLGAILSRILVDPVPPVATIAPDLPASLDVFFAKAMAKSRDLRFQSVREMVDAFLQTTGTAGRASLSSYASLDASSPGLEPPPVAPVPPAASTGAPGTSTSLSGLPTVPLPAAAPSAEAASSTLTTANITKDPGVRPQRTGPSWTVGGLLALILVGGGVYGLSRWSADRPSAASAPEATGPKAQPTGDDTAVEPKHEAPPASASAEATTTPDAPSTPSTMPTSTAQALAPSAQPTAAPAQTAAPASRRPPKPVQTSKPTSGGWGF